VGYAWLHVITPAYSKVYPRTASEPRNPRNLHHRGSDRAATFPTQAAL